MLPQMTWPPQSSDLNLTEMVWDELDRRVKAKQPTSAQHLWELPQDCWKIGVSGLIQISILSIPGVSFGSSYCNIYTYVIGYFFFSGYNALTQPS